VTLIERPDLFKAPGNIEVSAVASGKKYIELSIGSPLSAALPSGAFPLREQGMQIGSRRRDFPQRVMIIEADSATIG
jgi:hypothetical protein